MKINNKSIDLWIKEHPEIEDLINYREIMWINKNKLPINKALEAISLNINDVKEAEERLNRFKPYFIKAFPETAETGGIIESPLKEIPLMKKSLESDFHTKISGNLYLKCDHLLPVSGSIKARGGIYEVLKHAEALAVKENIIKPEDDYSLLLNHKDFFSKHAIAVSSTGNLGLSIGIISATLGFKTTVHMSQDARKWKKDMLRKKGVHVIEYDKDYSYAVIKGREQAQKDPLCHFVDDEDSKDLFLGYSVAALRLKKQIDAMNIEINSNNPLFVYLPCGVGGGPGGVAFGLKLIFGDNVHCFFAEPTHSPCMVLGLLTGLHDQIAVQDLGIDNLTAADGLAVGRASKFVGKIVENLLSGSYTVSDDKMYFLLNRAYHTENEKIEPSGLAGLYGPVSLLGSKEGLRYIEENNLKDCLKNAVHLPWATGGSMVPLEDMNKFIETGESIKLS